MIKRVQRGECNSIEEGSATGGLVCRIAIAGLGSGGSYLGQLGTVELVKNQALAQKSGLSHFLGVSQVRLHKFYRHPLSLRAGSEFFTGSTVTISKNVVPWQSVRPDRRWSSATNPSYGKFPCYAT